MISFWIYFLSLLALNHSLLVRKITTNMTMKFDHKTAQFGLLPGQYNVTGKLVVSDTQDGCAPPNATYKNCIVLIKRGNCVFSTKVLHAQEHGAVGVIIGNNQASNDWVTMVAQNKTAVYRIPAVFIQNQAYNFLYSQCASEPTRPKPPSAPSHVVGKRRLPTTDVWIAILNEIGEQTQGEYRTGSHSSMTIWKFVGYLLLFIPTVWCLVTVVLVIVRFLKSCVNRQRRVRKLQSIPIIEFVGTEKEHLTSTSTDNTTHLVQTDTEETGETRETLESAAPVVTASTAETSETKLLEANSHEPEDNTANNSSSRISTFWSSFAKRNSRQPLPHNDTCSVCLEEFERGKKISLLPCRHGFHTECITPWLRRQSEFCPTCRQSIFADDSQPSWQIFKWCSNQSRGDRSVDNSGSEMIALPSHSDDEDDEDDRINGHESGREIENDVDVFLPNGSGYAELPNSSLTREQKIVLQSVRRMGL